MAILIVESRLIVTNHIREVYPAPPNRIVFHYTDGSPVDVYLPENIDIRALIRELAELWFSNRVIHFDSWVKKFKKAESDSLLAGDEGD